MFKCSDNIWKFELKKENCGKVESHGDVVLGGIFSNFHECLDVGGDEETSGVNEFGILDRIEVFLKMFSRIFASGCEVSAQSSVFINNDHSACSSWFFSLVEVAVDSIISAIFLKNLSLLILPDRSKISNTSWHVLVLEHPVG